MSTDANPRSHTSRPADRATLAFTLLACLGYSASHAQYGDDYSGYRSAEMEAPAWTAGGHYTAEIDLSARMLTVMPLEGADIHLTLPLCNDRASAWSNSLATGVYLLHQDSEGTSLTTTHPSSALPVSAEESFAVEDCANAAGNAALALSSDAMNLLAAHQVAAVYVKTSASQPY